jgi:hypothetical protein
MTTLVDGKVASEFTTHIPHENMSVALMGYVGSPAQEWYGGAPASSFQGLDTLSTSAPFRSVF